MSVTKRILFGNGSEYAEPRSALAMEFWDRASQFKHRVALKRRNELPGPFWDASWPNCLRRAIDELCIEAVPINGGLFFRSPEDKSAVTALAEKLWRMRIAERAGR
jgi:hypothetical protein